MTEKGQNKKTSQLRNEKNLKTFFVSKFLSSNPSARLEKKCWPVMVVKLRKGQKILKNLEKNLQILTNSL